MWSGPICLGTFYKNAESNVRNAGLFALLSKSTSDPERTGPFRPSLLLLLSKYARDIYLPCPCCAIPGSSGIERVKENKKQENASHIKLLFAPPFCRVKKICSPPNKRTETRQQQTIRLPCTALLPATAAISILHSPPLSLFLSS